MSITNTFFGNMPDGKEVRLFTITNSNGIILQVITLGATLQALYTPDKYGRVSDITVGFDSLYGHLNFTDYQGKVVGRYANRIANGSFEMNGKTIQLTKNEKGKTCLHSAGEFSNAVWDAKTVGENAVELFCTSPDGASGYEGKMDARVRYTLTEDNKVEIEYSAVSDKDTVINFTNHTYFNLSGSAMSDVLGHILKINAKKFTPTDSDSIPTGQLRSVVNTPFDFNNPTTIGKRINENDEQLVMCKGYDHNFCLDHVEGEADIVAYEPVSGRQLSVYTDLPGVQLYTGNFLDGTIIGKGGLPLVKHAGFCLETQYYPDTPNHANFPQCTFKAGEEFKSKTVFAINVF